MANSVFVGPFGIAFNGSGFVFPSPGLFPDGAVGAPGISFANEPASGRYRIGTNNIGESINGVLVYDWNATRVNFAQPVLVPFGTNALPGLAFGGDPTTGWYGSAAVIRLALGGVANIVVVTNGAMSVNGTFSVGTALTVGTKVTQINGVNTAGSLGVPAVYGEARVLGTVNALVASVAAYTVGAADGSFLVGANINVSAATVASMTVTCTYTDETNTSRVLTFQFEQNGTAVYISAITNATGVGAYSAALQQIRCKAATTITIATTGTVTGITYNAEGTILQVA